MYIYISIYIGCMEIIVKTLKEKGGQIRQFIHDDKGTVCIGTYGFIHIYIYIYIFISYIWMYTYVMHIHGYI
jgi:hypothetical protein